MSGKKWSWPQVTYLGWASLVTLASARLFYGYMLQQTGGEWSAPLDDVFIHFDYARATARGYPFQWTEGNGYSSGGTSLLYPLVLALGYWVGFRGPELMVWAAVVAAMSVLGFLWAGCRGPPWRCSLRRCSPWAPSAGPSGAAWRWRSFSASGAWRWPPGSR
jgi:hypothetical protein